MDDNKISGSEELYNEGVTAKTINRIRNINMNANYYFGIDTTLFELKRMMDERQRVASYLSEGNIDQEEEDEYNKLYDYLNNKIKLLLRID